MNTETQPDKLVVSQDDRDLVFSLMSPCARNEVEVLALQYIRDGMGDDAEAVQEVAAHRQRAMNQAADERQEMWREALTPSGDTKAEYHGEFYISLTRTDEAGDEHSERVYVPWTTVKEIMAAIHKRAIRSIGKGGM